MPAGHKTKIVHVYVTVKQDFKWILPPHMLRVFYRTFYFIVKTKLFSGFSIIIVL